MGILRRSKSSNYAASVCFTGNIRQKAKLTSGLKHMSLSSIIADLSKQRRIAERQLASANKAYLNGRIRPGVCGSLAAVLPKRRALLQKIEDFTVAIEAIRAIETAPPKPVLHAGIGEREAAIIG